MENKRLFPRPLALRSARGRPRVLKVSSSLNFYPPVTRALRKIFGRIKPQQQHTTEDWPQSRDDVQGFVV